MTLPPPSKRASFFGPLPTRGVWTALELTRAQFLVILAGSVALFVFVDGPVWRHTHASHFWRIGISYAGIPLAVTAALYRNGKANAAPIIVATVVIALLKLVATALLLVAVSLAQT